VAHELVQKRSGAGAKVPPFADIWCDPSAAQGNTAGSKG